MKFEASDAGEGSFGLEQTRTAKQRVPDMRRPLQCLKNASKGLFSLTTEKSGLATVGIATESRRPDKIRQGRDRTGRTVALAIARPKAYSPLPR